jgi:hypothetical protein
MIPIVTRAPAPIAAAIPLPPFIPRIRVMSIHQSSFGPVIPTERRRPVDVH